MRAKKAKALRKEAKHLANVSGVPLVSYADKPYLKAVATLKGLATIEVYTRFLVDSQRKIYKLLKKMEG